MKPKTRRLDATQSPRGHAREMMQKPFPRMPKGSEGCKASEAGRQSRGSHVRRCDELAKTMAGLMTGAGGTTPWAGRGGGTLKGAMTAAAVDTFG